MFSYTVHDTENLTFSADDRAENPHITARLFARTISGFNAEQLADSVRNSADLTSSCDYHNPQVWNVDYTNFVVERFV